MPIDQWIKQWAPEQTGPRITYTPALELHLARESCQVSWTEFFLTMNPRQRSDIIAVHRLKTKIAIVQSARK